MSKVSSHKRNNLRVHIFPVVIGQRSSSWVCENHHSQRRLFPSRVHSFMIKGNESETDDRNRSARRALGNWGRRIHPNFCGSSWLGVLPVCIGQERHTLLGPQFIKMVCLVGGKKTYSSSSQSGVPSATSSVNSRERRRSCAPLPNAWCHAAAFHDTAVQQLNFHRYWVWEETPYVACAGRLPAPDWLEEVPGEQWDMDIVSR